MGRSVLTELRDVRKALANVFAASAHPDGCLMGILGVDQLTGTIPKLGAHVGGLRARKQPLSDDNGKGDFTSIS